LGACRKRRDLVARDSGNCHAFRAAFLARDDSNSRNWHIQTLGQQAPQGVVRAIFQRGRGEPNLQRALVFALNRIAATKFFHITAVASRIASARAATGRL
jgi:hypothetical protein